MKKGNKADHINACLKTSYLWYIIKTIRLTENMRVKLDSVIENDSFPEKLLKIGNGNIDENEQLPCGISVENLEELTGKVYQEISKKYVDTDWLCERCILAAKNENVTRINSELLKKIPEIKKTYRPINIH